MSNGDFVFSRSFIDRTLAPRWAGADGFEGAKGFSIDTRTLQAGEIFVALRTGRRDGHEFLSAAAKARAAAALVSEAPANPPLPLIVVPDTLDALQRLGAAWRRRWGGRIVAVTGSCGKTSTKELLGEILGAEDTLVSPGNLNNHIGVPLSLLLLRPHHRRAVIEAGINEGGEMDMLADWIAPEAAVVTTIGPAHLEKLGSLEGIAAEKARLPLAASESVFLGPACAGYEAFTGGAFASPHWLLPVVSDGLPGLRGDVWRIFCGEGEVRLHPHADGGRSLAFPAPRATPGMIENMALAALVARVEGVSDETIIERLASWRPVPQRGEVLEVQGRVFYADHYNANPASFADAVHFFNKCYPQAPRVWVIGGMEELGAESPAWHRKLAEALPLVDGDCVFLVGEATREMLPVLSRRIEPDRVVHAEKADEIAGKVAASPGAVFLKGSRIHALEKILDSLADAV